MLRFVVYQRVSTARQMGSGLELAAQEQSIYALAADRSATVIAAFTEVESGSVADRSEPSTSSTRGSIAME